MARREIVVLEDDLDGGTADETVKFSLDGTQYEMASLSGNTSSGYTATLTIGAAPTRRKICSAARKIRRASPSADG